MKSLKNLFENNIAWAAKINEKKPDFFSNQSKKQTPKYLWIGCSDSRVSETRIVNLPPGEIFVHRNIANVVVHSDLNCLSVIQYAVEVLKVEHIIVCGHYGCGGIKAAMDNKMHGLIDNWLCHIKDITYSNLDKLELLNDEQKFDLLCELNTIEQVKNVCQTSIVQRIWETNVELYVHGWMYNISNGLVKDLNVCISSTQELHKLLKS